MVKHVTKFSWRRSIRRCAEMAVMIVFQYKVILQATGGEDTSASNVTVAVVNATPEVQNVLASQSASGTVAISYQARDADTDSGTYNPGFVSSTFAYLDAEGAYQTIPSNELTAGAMINQPVATSTYTTSTLVWTPPAGLSVAASRIRVTINDNELANNTASANSATFLLDSVSPVVSSTNSVIVDASSTPAFLTLSASDTSTMQMRISLNSDMSGSSWVAMPPPPPSLSHRPGHCLRSIQSAYSNTSAIISVTLLKLPIAPLFKTHQCGHRRLPIVFDLANNFCSRKWL